MTARVENKKAFLRKRLASYFYGKAPFSSVNILDVFLKRNKNETSKMKTKFNDFFLA